MWWGSGEVVRGGFFEFFLYMSVLFDFDSTNIYIFVIYITNCYIYISIYMCIYVIYRNIYITFIIYKTEKI